MAKWYVSDSDGIECCIRDAGDPDGIDGGDGVVAQNLSPVDAEEIVMAVNGGRPTKWIELLRTARSFVSARGHGRLNWEKSARISRRFEAALAGLESDPLDGEPKLAEAMRLLAAVCADLQTVVDEEEEGINLANRVEDELYAQAGEALVAYRALP
jgi:hypothetical protein